MVQPAKPVETQISEGDPRRKGKRKLYEESKSHPKSTRELPPCPANFNSYQREAWQVISNELSALEIDFGRADVVTLRGCAIVVGRAAQAHAQIEEINAGIASGKLRGERGIYARLRGLEQLEHRQWELYLKFADRLGGLHPVGRTRVKVKKRSKRSIMEILRAPEKKQAVQ